MKRNLQCSSGLFRLYRWIPGFLLVAAVSSVGSQPIEQLASVMPIADVHFHLMRFMSPEELSVRMEKNGVAWTISAGAIGSLQLGGPRLRDTGAKRLLGKKFLPAAGSGDIYQAERAEGAEFYTNENSALRLDVLKRIEDQLAIDESVLPETFPNAVTSSEDPLRRRRLPTDAIFFKSLFDLSAQRVRPVPMHMQWHQESVAGLEKLLISNSAGTILLSHCGKDTVSSDIRTIFEKHQNVYCDLGFRSPPQAAKEGVRFPSRIIFWGPSFLTSAGIKEDWRQLIENYPDRFMVAIDDVQSWEEYDKVVIAIREGILAKLRPETAEKVAYKNAVRLFRLE